MSLLRLLIIIVVTTWATAPAVRGATFSSGTEKVALIELYTSEGCNSCPSADKWLAALGDETGLWNRFVPVAFHVDYWDHLGWKDPFASRDNSERQRRYSREWNKDIIYTPGLVLDGSEWRTWRRDGGSWKAQKRAAAGELSLTIDGETAHLEFEPPSVPSSNLRAYVTVLGFGLASEVTGGENVGRTLKHDFVVLGLAHKTMDFKDGRHTARLDIPTPASTGANRYAVAAWVTQAKKPSPLQAVGGWLGDMAEMTGTEDVEMSDKIIKTDEEWRELLTAEQYNVTRQKGTERAFTGDYLDFKEEGLYLCVACGHSLFSSETKYDSGSGWPSFWQPLDKNHIDEESDRTMGMVRTEVLCGRCGAHLGHLFPDGPKPTGMRYCINSASLKFVRQDEMAEKENKNKEQE